MTLTIADIFSPRRASLAPLAGVTDSVFRRICAAFGACPVFTEMVSSEGLVRGHPSDKTTRLLRFQESERPIGFQFFGSDPDTMAEAVQRTLDRKPDFIDINAGCPVRKVIARGAGSALLTAPGVLARIVEKVAAVSTVPVTVKIRSGWNFAAVNAVEIARICADAGAQAVIVHPRTKSQGFGGDADWSVIGRVREAVDVPVVGSGDVRSLGDYLRMKEETGIEYVMVGRAAMTNPFIFREIADYCDGITVPYQTGGCAERLELALTQLDLIASEVSERFAVLNMRKFFGWYSRGSRGGTDFRQRVFRAETIGGIRVIVREFQEECRANKDEAHKDGQMVES